MSSSIPTTTAERRRSVFLAARAVFTGQKAFIRDRNTVEKLISKREKSFRKELLNLDKQPVIDITLSLLRKQVFESEEKAKLVFPELYHVSAVRGLQHDTSEKNAARSEADALEESEHVLYGAGDANGRRGHHAGKLTAEEASKPADITSPSLFPAYLSYAIQHKLLNTVQTILEECCYDFAARWLPRLVANHRWDCAEAVEILRWSEVLPSRFDRLSAVATSLESSEDLLEALKATHPLRHAAVHRHPTSGRGIGQMLEQALHLVRVLRDGPRTFRLEAILEDFRASIQDMELHKNQLENHLDEQLQDIQDRRAALDREEEIAKVNMIKQDVKNTKFISSLFEKSIANPPLDGSRHEELDEADFGPLEHDENADNDIEPTRRQCEEADSSTLEHDGNANNDVGSMHWEYYEPEASTLKNDDNAGNDVEPMQARWHEAEHGAFEDEENAENADSDMSPMQRNCHEPRASALNDHKNAITISDVEAAEAELDEAESGTFEAMSGTLDGHENETSDTELSKVESDEPEFNQHECYEKIFSNNIKLRDDYESDIKGNHSGTRIASNCMSEFGEAEPNAENTVHMDYGLKDDGMMNFSRTQSCSSANAKK